jgi:hypothetical protein
VTAADCRDCDRNTASLRRLDILTRQRAHEALAGHLDPFARATRAHEAAQARHDEHLAVAHPEVLA